jgi:hypothetical protein
MLLVVGVLPDIPGLIWPDFLALAVLLVPKPRSAISSVVGVNHAALSGLAITIILALVVRPIDEDHAAVAGDHAALELPLKNGSVLCNDLSKPVSRSVKRPLANIHRSIPKPNGALTRYGYTVVEINWAKWS